MMLCCDWLFFNSSDWCISILAVHSVICSLGGPLSHGSPVAVFLDRGHPRFWNFSSTIPVDADDPTKQDGVVYRIPCECGKVYIGETGKPL